MKLNPLKKILDAVPAAVMRKDEPAPLRRRVWVEIDLEALVRNYEKIAERAKPAQVLGVLKANAYGLGVKPYAKALAKAGCRMFGVAEPFEALELLGIARELGRPDIQILSSVLPDEIPEMVRKGVILPVIGLEEARLVSEAATRFGVPARVHFKIDSGMGRLGIPMEDALETMRAVRELPGLDCEGIFSHCPMAYDPHDPFTPRQIQRFKELVEAAEADGFAFKKIHIAASDAINNFPQCFEPPFNVVRTGINLHGSFDPNGRRALSVEPVLALKTRIAQVRTLAPGTTLGYGRTWCLKEPTRVATISAGYADGLPLALANRSQVLIKGVRCPVIGRVSMDYTTVDASLVPNPQPGDEVVCLGRSGGETVTPDDWAALKGTHAYDIICSLGSRVERVAVGAF